jgi:hypothetical protein
LLDEVAADNAAVLVAADLPRNEQDPRSGGGEHAMGEAASGWKARRRDGLRSHVNTAPAE